MQTENWDDFRFVIAVIENGSLNAAARSLGVNHATVLRRVNGFQERFDIEVFDRDSSGYKVRADQSSIIEALGSLRLAIETAERAMKGQGAGIRGPIKITSTDSLCDSLLPNLVSEFQQSHPEVAIDLISTNSHLDMGQLDAEVTVRPALSLPQELIGEKAGNLAFAVYAHPSYLANWRALVDSKWLMCSGGLMRSPCGVWQQANVEPEQISFSADSFISLRQLCMSGLGLAILPCCIVERQSPLKKMDGFFKSMQTGIWVANHKDLNQVPRIVACREFLIKGLRNYKEFLNGDD